MVYHTLSLRQSFDNGFDDFTTEAYMATGTLQASGSSTSATDAPLYALSVEPGRWINRATEVLDEIDALPDSLIARERLYLPEQSMHHRSEADVVRAAAMYLLHPINQALSNYSFTAGTFKCQSEITAHNVRSDITYHKTPSNMTGPQIPKNMRAFLVVEFKKQGMLQSNQFRAAIMPTATHSDRRAKIQWITRHCYTSGDQENTAFDNESQTIMKQASSYAVAHGIKFVAIFNWDQLILVKFNVFNPLQNLVARRKNGVGEECEMSIISDSRVMRRALLGFAREAWEAMQV